MFFPRGTIVYNRDTKCYRLCIGTIHNILILAWKVKTFKLPTQKGQQVMGFAVGSGEDINSEVCWINPLDVDSYEVVPTVVASPMHLFILNKRKIHNYSGIVFIQTGRHCEVYEHAAKNCFSKCHYISSRHYAVSKVFLHHRQICLATFSVC